MAQNSLIRLAYRCLQRVMVLERVTVMVAETNRMTLASGDSRVERLQKKRLAEFLAQGDAPYCDELIEQLADPRLSCFGVVNGGRLQSFSWLFCGSADADMNYGYCQATATPIELAGHTAFVFHSYTLGL